ncbi:hypothetical protein M426DRAFT_263445 [Hypoxylon sp. CI-4A]|nr:hypothetical protein M426DRAFT_263445 [Hypoxylon sp. CI-4A]
MTEDSLQVSRKQDKTRYLLFGLIASQDGKERRMSYYYSGSNNSSNHQRRHRPEEDMYLERRTGNPRAVSVVYHPGYRDQGGAYYDGYYNYTTGTQNSGSHLVSQSIPEDAEAQRITEEAAAAAACPPVPPAPVVAQGQGYTSNVAGIRSGLLQPQHAGSAYSSDLSSYYEPHNHWNGNGLGLYWGAPDLMGRRYLQQGRLCRYR